MYKGGCVDVGWLVVERGGGGSESGANFMVVTPENNFSPNIFVMVINICTKCKYSYTRFRYNQ